jgi:hypothetical protein
MGEEGKVSIQTPLDPARSWGDSHQDCRRNWKAEGSESLLSKTGETESGNQEGRTDGQGHCLAEYPKEREEGSQEGGATIDVRGMWGRLEEYEHFESDHCCFLYFIFIVKIRLMPNFNLAQLTLKSL